MRPGHQKRIDSVDQLPYATQVVMIYSAHTANGYADSVDGNRIIDADLFQQVRRMGIGNEVFRMNFKPSHVWPRARDLVQVGQAQTHSGASRNLLRRI